MNRLILIGNGFDLAHKIESSFNDFIEWYLAKVYNAFLSNDYEYSDELFSLTRIYEGYFPALTPITANQAKQKFIELNKYPKSIFMQVNPLFDNIFSKSNNLKWVDIEMEYFTFFAEIRDNVNKKKQSDEDIDILNDQFDYLRSQFLEYLHEQQDNFVNDFAKTELVQCFTEPINPKENDDKPNDIHFLNFNYTRTLEAYVAETSKIIPSTINYIHGNLDGSKGEPIFGYGDEMDKKFAEFEHDNDNRLFKHIKSFGYLKNSNYANLLRFIEAEDFQVHIYGHSCGLSDRTMLHEIFEHKRCKSIKIFFHEKDDGTNDFTDKTYEIYRHFNNKELVRKRIVDFSLSRPMPQPCKELLS